MLAGKIVFLLWMFPLAVGFVTRGHRGTVECLIHFHKVDPRFSHTLMQAKLMIDLHTFTFCCVILIIEHPLFHSVFKIG